MIRLESSVLYECVTRMGRMTRPVRLVGWDLPLETADFSAFSALLCFALLCGNTLDSYPFSRRIKASHDISNSGGLGHGQHFPPFLDSVSWRCEKPSYQTWPKA